MSPSVVTVRQFRSVTGEPTHRSKMDGVSFERPTPSGTWQ
jgi:hypothetical protein